MPDVWATVAELDETTQERLADVLETRGADRQQQEMRRAFLADVDFPADAAVLEVGCGTGVLTRVLAALPEVETVIGVDIAASLLVRARELAPDIEFVEADARSLPPTLMAGCGFQVANARSHGFVDPGHGGYMLTVVDRGADMLHASGRIGEDLAAALKAEARRRADADSFFGHIAYASVIARR